MQNTVASKERSRKEEYDSRDLGHGTMSHQVATVMVVHQNEQRGVER